MCTWVRDVCTYYAYVLRLCRGRRFGCQIFRKVEFLDFGFRYFGANMKGVAEAADSIWYNVYGVRVACVILQPFPTFPLLIVEAWRKEAPWMRLRP